LNFIVEQPNVLTWRSINVPVYFAYFSKRQIPEFSEVFYCYFLGDGLLLHNI
jgi:hypothetical protein